MGRKTLRLCPIPKAEESFSSWVQRVAIVNGLEFWDFVVAVNQWYVDAIFEDRLLWLRHPAYQFNPDRVEHQDFVARMAAASGLPAEFLEAFTLKSFARFYHPTFLVPCGKRWLFERATIREKEAIWCADSYCPLCLAEDYFLRRLWRPAFLCYCLVHQRPLAERCPRCQNSLDYYGLQGHQISVLRKGKLFCGHCGLDLTLPPAGSAASQHRAAIKCLGDMLEGSVNVNPPKYRSQILNTFHWWSEAFFQTCTRLPDKPASHQSSAFLQQRKGYVYQPPQVRFALLETALKTMGRLGQRQSEFSLDDVACSNWLGPFKWRELLDVAVNLVTWFPELNEQETVSAPDSSVLPLLRPDN